MKTSPFSPTAALERYHARHAAAGDIQHDMAAFSWDPDFSAYLVVVRDWVVLQTPDLSDVCRFCLMHNGRIAR